MRPKIVSGLMEPGRETFVSSSSYPETCATDGAVRKHGFGDRKLNEQQKRYNKYNRGDNKKKGPPGVGGDDNEEKGGEFNEKEKHGNHPERKQTSQPEGSSATSAGQCSDK